MNSGRLDQKIKPHFRPDVEGLRGIAILLVVLYHAKLPAFSGGFVGVDVFFVLSGYLITWLLVREIEGTGKLDLLAFYARRARRLLPAMALVVFAVMLVGFVVYSPIEQRLIAPSALTTSAYVSNLHLAWVATDYLGFPAEANPLLHTWSLSVEEQFYLIWPLLVLLAFRARRGSNKLEVQRRRILMVMGIVALVSFAACLWLTFTKQPWAFFSSPTRAWEFAIGGLGVLVAPKTRYLTQALGWCGFAAILGSAVGFGAHTVFPGFAALLPALGTVAVVCAGASGSETGLPRYISARPLQKIGNLSYSWYLWHWPILTFAAVIGGELDLWTRLLCLAVSFGLAAVSFRLVENPIRRKKVLAIKPMYALGMAVCLYISSVGTAMLWRYVARSAAQSPEQQRFTRASVDFPVYDNPTCQADMLESQAQGCTFNSTNALKTVVLVGDSHAAQWYPALRSIAETQKWRLVTFTKSLCPATDVEFINPKLNRRYTECEQWRADVFQRISDLQPDLVVVSNSHVYAAGSNPLVSLPDWIIGTKRTLQSISRSAARVIFLQDTPSPGINIPICMARAAWHSNWITGGSCAVSKEKAIQAGVKQVEQQTAAMFPGVEYLDMTDYICPGEICEPERDGQVIYSDTNHLTSSFVTTLTPVLQKLITRR